MSILKKSISRRHSQQNITIQRTCQQHNILDRMRRVLCDDSSIILKKIFLRNIVNDENLQVIGEKQTKD